MNFTCMSFFCSVTEYCRNYLLYVETEIIKKKTLKPAQGKTLPSPCISSHNFTGLLIFECLLKIETKASFSLW